ncbi:MAG: lactonase family protein [Chloroflexota bacterium]|nr:lactonase family protein [Chloroflexota bacterium]
MDLYVGTYTGPGRAEGIGVFRIDAATGGLTHLHTIAGVDNPSFLALHPRGTVLYAVNETPAADGPPAPGVSALAIDPASGRVTLLNRQPSHGTSPCYVSLDAAGRFAFVANYGNGILAVYPVEADGSLGAATDVVQHAGSGPHPRRQLGPHAHSVRMDPAGQFVLACDLGMDRVLVYRLDAAAGRLIPHDPPAVATPPGSGPRHLAFHPGGSYLYVNNEIDSSVTAFAYGASQGTLNALQTLSTLPDGFSGANSTAQVAVHPSGKTVYVSNRGHDSIAVFGVEAATGRLTSQGQVPTQGQTPRNFNIDPRGTFLYVANQNSDSIVVFRIDAASGGLTPTGQVTQTPAPVCLVFRRT